MEGYSEKIINPDVELTPELGSELFIGSFGIGQADPRIQLHIFRYLHFKFPTWTMDTNLINQIVAISLPQIQNIVYKGRSTEQSPTKQYDNHPLNIPTSDVGPEIPITDATIRQNMWEELNIMTAILNNTYLTDSSVQKLIEIRGLDSQNLGQIMPNLIQLMIARDAYFKAKGRTREVYKEYVLEGKSTNVPIYDQMMKELKDYYDQNTTLEEKP